MSAFEITFGIAVTLIGSLGTYFLYVIATELPLLKNELTHVVTTSNDHEERLRILEKR